jgi:hypothetical protein
MACHGAPLLSGAYINDAFSLRLRQFSILPVKHKKKTQKNHKKTQKTHKKTQKNTKNATKTQILLNKNNE